MTDRDPITLRCSHCGNSQSYGRNIDPDLPKEVVLIVTDECDKCDAGSGGWPGEQWFDALGKEVVPL